MLEAHIAGTQSHPKVRVRVRLMAVQIGDIFGDYRVTGVWPAVVWGKDFGVRSLVRGREDAMKNRSSRSR